MLKAIQQALGGKPEANAELDAVRVEFAEFKQTAEALLLSAEEHVAELKAQLDAANAKLAEVAELAAAAEAAKAQAEADAAAAKLAARKEKVIAAVGTERADALLKVAEGMEDAAFEAVLSALTVGAAAEAANPLFTEVGVDATADTTKVVEESAEMKLLKAKYHKQDQ